MAANAKRRWAGAAGQPGRHALTSLALGEAVRTTSRNRRIRRFQRSSLLPRSIHQIKKSEPNTKAVRRSTFGPFMVSQQTYAVASAAGTNNHSSAATVRAMTCPRVPGTKKFRRTHASVQATHTCELNDHPTCNTNVDVIGPAWYVAGYRRCGRRRPSSRRRLGLRAVGPVARPGSGPAPARSSPSRRRGVRRRRGCVARR